MFLQVSGQLPLRKICPWLGLDLGWGQFFLGLIVLGPFLHVKQTFFNVKREGFCLQALHLRKTIYFVPPCWGDGRRRFLIYESETLANKKIPFFTKLDEN